MTYQNELEFVVRDYECDLQGMVNNANYLHYFEHARHQWLESLGIDFAALHKDGIDMVVVRIEGGGGGAGVQDVGRVGGDLSDRGGDLRVDADAFGDCHVVAGRDCVARDVLSAGGVEARGGLSQQVGGAKVPPFARGAKDGARSGGCPYGKTARARCPPTKRAAATKARRWRAASRLLSGMQKAH